MTLATIVFLFAVTLATATLSGVFGMAGGLALMGALALILPVPAAMVTHGLIQIASNLSRATLLRRHISWGVTARYGVGAAAGAGLLVAALAAWRPSPAVVFILLGLTPLLAWLPRRWAPLDITSRWQAEACGLAVQTLNSLAGVAGPLLDLFFVRAELPRQTVVATKAATQIIAHAIKIAVWSAPLVAAAREGAAALPPVWALVACAGLALMGTWLGGLMLARMTDKDFRTWTRWLVTAIGAVYLIQGAALASA
jgi:uncharacterized membrane protein YfcA